MNSIVFTCYRTTKKGLYEAVQPYVKSKFRAIITPIIALNRSISIEDAKLVSRLNSVEVVEFCLKSEIPFVNLGKDVEFNGGQVEKKEVLTKIPHLNHLDFEKFLNPIVSDYRGVCIDEIKRVRKLNFDELIDFLEQIGEIIERESPEPIELVEYPPKSNEIIELVW